MVLVASGAFSIATASTAVAATWPGGSAAASSAELTSVTQPQSTGVSSELQREEALRAYLASQAKAREAAAARKAAAKKKAAAAAARKKKEEQARDSGTPQQIAQGMLSQFGWSSDQFSCLDPLWERESGWNVYAYNPGSSAYGIPQALPGSKMASAGPDWQSDASTQIRWGLDYIKDTYGSPCGAWDHEEEDGWY
jgi:hypothetical protein